MPLFNILPVKVSNGAFEVAHGRINLDTNVYYRHCASSSILWKDKCFTLNRDAEQQLYDNGVEELHWSYLDKDKNIHLYYIHIMELPYFEMISKRHGKLRESNRHIDMDKCCKVELHLLSSELEDERVQKRMMMRRLTSQDLLGTNQSSQEREPQHQQDQ